MKPIALALPKHTTDIRYESWLNIIKRQESANILFTPWSDKYYRVRQFIDMYLQRVLPQTQTAVVVAESFTTEASGEFEIAIRQLFADANNPRLVFLMDGDWIAQSAPHLFARIQLLTEVPEAPIQFITIFESDISSLTGTYPQLKYEILAKNKLYWPLYTKSEISHFLNYKSRKFGIKLNKSQIEIIATACGGHIWLATCALRVLANTGLADLKANEFIQRLDLILNSFSDRQKLLLEKCSRDLNPDTNIPENEYLERVGIIDQANKLTIPALKNHILKKTSKTITVSQNNIFVNGINVSQLFTDKEIRALSLLIGSRELLSREEIATCFWPDEEYSDWAMDQSISRLRQKLNKLGVPKENLKAVKGKGFRWRQYE